MKKILCLTDFSDNAYNAILYANELAKQFSSTLILMHTYELDIDTKDNNFTLPTLISHSDTESRNILSKICMDLKREDKYGKTSYEYIIREGGISKNLNKIIVEQKIDLVIFSVEGSLNKEDNFYGNIVSELVQSTKCPVMAIPTGVKYKKIENCIYAFDIENEDTFEEDIITISKLLDTHITILSYIKTEDEKEIEKIYTKFNLLKQEADFSKIQLEIKSTENTFTALKEFCEDRKAELLVLENHKRMLHKRLTEKSFTKEFIFIANIPVLIIRSKED